MPDSAAPHRHRQRDERIDALRRAPLGKPAVIEFVGGHSRRHAGRDQDRAAPQADAPVQDQLFERVQRAWHPEPFRRLQPRPLGGRDQMLGRLGAALAALRMLDLQEVQAEGVQLPAEGAVGVAVIGRDLDGRLRVQPGEPGGHHVQPDELALDRPQPALIDPDVVGRAVGVRPGVQRLLGRPGLDPSVEGGQHDGRAVLARALHLAGLHHHGRGRQVGSPREVGAGAHALAGVLGRIEVGQHRLERRPGDPGLVGVGPDAEVQPQDAVQLARHVAGLLDHVGEVLLGEDCPQERVGLGPAARVFKRVVAGIQRADVGEGAVADRLADIGERLVRRARTGRDPHRVLVLLPADRVAVAARVGDHHQERLPAELEAPLQHVHHVARRVLMHLVAEREVRARTRAALARLAADRPEERSGAHVGDVVAPADAAAEREPLGERGGLLHHLHRVREEDHGLILLRRGGVDLGAGLAVGGHAVEAQAAGEGRLPVALALLDVGATEATRAVRPLPAHQRAQLEGLTRVEQERNALELALRELEHALPPAPDVLGGGQVPAQAALRAVHQIVQVAAAGVADVGPGDVAALHDIDGVGGGAVAGGDQRLSEACRLRCWAAARSSRRPGLGRRHRRGSPSTRRRAWRRAGRRCGGVPGFPAG